MIFCSSFITIASALKRFGELLILGDFFLGDIFLGDNFLGEFLFGEVFRLGDLFLISCPFLS